MDIKMIFRLVLVLVIIVVVWHVFGSKGPISVGSGKEMLFTAANVTKIYVEDVNNAIKVMPQNGDEVTVSYYEDDNAGYDIKVDNGALSVTYKDKKPWYMRLINFKLKQHEVVIKVPADVLQGLKLKTVNGGLTVSDITVSGDVKMETVNGGHSLKTVKGIESLTLSTVNGGMTLLDVQAQSVLAKGVNGGITLVDVTAENLHATTTNGGITAKLRGKSEDYLIDASATVGKCNVPAGSAAAGKQIKLSTTTGGINVTFSGE